MTTVNQQPNHEYGSLPASSSASSHSVPTSRDSQTKTRRRRACDACRRKRIRCDGSEGPGALSNCWNCVIFQTNCTYNDIPKKSGPSKGYIKALEARIMKLESLLREDGRDIAKEPTLERGSDRDHSDDMGTGQLDTGPPVAFDSSRRISSADSDTSSDEEFLHAALVDKLHHLSLNTAQRQFLGQSDSMQLVKSALSMRAQQFRSSTDATLASFLETLRRQEFWKIQPWEMSLFEEHHPDYEFPEPDLLRALIDIYFERINCVSPLLHEPIFRADVQNGLHYRDKGFAAVLLMICAVASRYTNDSRVFVPGSNLPRSSGWRWFNQVHMVRKSLFSNPTLHDLQLRYLCGIFLAGSSVPHATWAAISQALRMAQDLGIHKQRFYGNKITLVGDLWKRVLWLLVSFERGLGTALGRQPTLMEREIEIDYPIDCDHEFWTNPEPIEPPKQPPHRPSAMTYFHLSLRLGKIFFESLSHLNALQSSALNAESDVQRIVANFDSAMNDWLSNVPPHLRWPQKNLNHQVFKQSALLHIVYYRDQILMHRPFISFAPSLSSFASSCTTVCVTAARSVISIADAFRQCSDSIPEATSVVFPACMMVLVQALAHKRAGKRVDQDKLVSELHRGILILEILKERMPMAGVMADMIITLATLGDVPLPRFENLHPDERHNAEAKDLARTLRKIWGPPYAEQDSSLTPLRDDLPGLHSNIDYTQDWITGDDISASAELSNEMGSSTSWAETVHDVGVLGATSQYAGMEADLDRLSSMFGYPAQPGASSSEHSASVVNVDNTHYERSAGLPAMFAPGTSLLNEGSDHWISSTGVQSRSSVNANGVSAGDDLSILLSIPPILGNLNNWETYVNNITSFMQPAISESE